MKSLSIVTINYNDQPALLRTLKSAVEQTWQGFEHIVIDGGSTDGSLDTIKLYQERFSHWVCEPDRGVFHAMNKGIAKANGEYLLMLNAGDLLYDENTLKRVFEGKVHSENILYGNAILEADGKRFGEKIFAKPLTFDFFRRTSLSHQSTFIRREWHDVVGLYDEDLRFSADWKLLLLSICKYNCSRKYLGDFIAICDCGGLTWNGKNFPSMREEMSMAMNEHFPAFVSDYDAFDTLRDKKTAYRKLLDYGKQVTKKIIRGSQWGSGVKF